MNNYSIVFNSVKKYCQNSPLLDRECFERVISDIERKKTLNNPNQYLDTLQDLGLIKYCPENKIIGLTEKGKQINSLF